MTAAVFVFTRRRIHYDWLLNCRWVYTNRYMLASRFSYNHDGDLVKSLLEQEWITKCFLQNATNDVKV